MDILGFSDMLNNKSPKIPKIFEMIDSLSSFGHFAFTTISFSDTVLVFNKDNDSPPHYYVTYLIEFAQQLFYKLLSIGVYYKGIITCGEFEYHELTNINSYWGNALIEAYNDEKNIKGFGLFIRKDMANDVIVLDKQTITDKYDFVYLCQSYINLYKYYNGILPIDIEVLTETDDYARIDEDLKFFREIEFLKKNHPNNKIRKKYSTVYNWYKKKTPKFFKIFQKQGFYPFILNHNYLGTINPFIITAELNF